MAQERTRAGEGAELLHLVTGDGYQRTLTAGMVPDVNKSAITLMSQQTQLRAPDQGAGA